MQLKEKGCHIKISRKVFKNNNQRERGASFLTECFSVRMSSGCFLRCAGVAHLGKLIDLYSYPVRTAMRFLLGDKTTGENIIWATNTYERYGDGYRQDNQITPILSSRAF